MAATRAITYKLQGRHEAVCLYVAGPCLRPALGRGRLRGCAIRAPTDSPTKSEGASTDLAVITERLKKLVKPYWIDNPDADKPRRALAGVVVLSLMTTGVSVVFNFLGRDFFNALSAKDQATFYGQLAKYLGGFAVGIPVFVLRDYFMALLALRWREWMAEDMMSSYMSDKTFYNIAAGQVVDNPDQRLTSDINQFTSSTLTLSFTFLTSIVDLVSFSGILFSIYPPLFIVLVAYALGGTALSFVIGKKLVGLNFNQEAREADLRYGLVRVRENAESIAFYDGAKSEVGLLYGRLGRVVANYRDLLVASRNLDFFQSAYRYIIILLPAAVVAPLYFRGEIEFGVVNQSQSAFSHILSDVSLVVYQFESLAGFSAVVDRLGEFQETVAARGRFAQNESSAAEDSQLALPPGSAITYKDAPADGDVLVSITGLTLCTPNYKTRLASQITLDVARSDRLVVTGPSGCGKTSLLRAIAGLWTSGEGHITRPALHELAGGQGGMMFVPQKPYMVLGSLRQQLLYPVFEAAVIDEALQTFDENDGQGSLLDPRIDARAVVRPVRSAEVNGAASDAASVLPLGSADADPSEALAAGARSCPTDEALVAALDKVALSALVRGPEGVAALDAVKDWSSVLSLGEQQRLAMARVVLARPALVLLDESTSALDLANEERMYQLLNDEGIAYVSVGHRSSLMAFHDKVLKMALAESAEVATRCTVEDIKAAAPS